MSKYFLILLLNIFLLNFISPIIIINATTKNNTDIFFIKIKEQIQDFTADFKVNNKTINTTFSGEYILISKESGEIDIIIYSNLSSLESLFNGNRKIESIKIKCSDQNVVNLVDMFNYSQCLTYVDISEFDISRVSNFTRMFYKCGNLVSVKFGNYTTSNALDMDSMFYDCYK